MALDGRRKITGVADMTDEIWKAVGGFEGLYEVSSLGRVRSLPRVMRANYGPREYGGKILSPVARKLDGYLIVSLYRTSKRYQRTVHAIVIESFKGPAPAGMQCCHNNGVRSDCRAENLRWGTSLENSGDKEVHGTALKGEKCGNAKLNEEQVVEILYSSEPHNIVGSRFGVSAELIGLIRNGNAWRHVERKPGMYTRQAAAWIVDGISYSTLVQASEALGVAVHVLRYRCKGRHAKGKFYPPAEGCRFVEGNPC